MLSHKRRCPGCRHDLNSNAFPRGSRRCHGCTADRKRKEAHARMPAELRFLAERLDDIERSSDWEYRFISDLIERFESASTWRLTPKQRDKIGEIYRKYEADDGTT